MSMSASDDAIYGAKTWSVRDRMSRPLVLGVSGMVAAGHYHAAFAGLRVLAAGGNAIDAGVSAGLVLNVVHNDMCSLSGVAPIILYHAATARVTTIAGIGPFPRAITLEYFVKERGGKIPGDLSRCIVPAAADAWLVALSNYGTMRFSDVAADAIRLAEDGFPVHHFMAHSIKTFLDGYRRHPTNRAIYLRNGEPPQVGDVIVQHDLAKTLRALCDVEDGSRGGTREQAIDAVRDYFYRGPIARTMVEFSRRNGGFFTEDDFASFRAAEEPAGRVGYRGYELYGCGPWSQGPALLVANGILAEAPLEQFPHNGPDAVHHIVEALKLGFADRERYCGDPRFIDVPMDRLLSPDYLAARRARIDPTRACPEMPEAGEIAGFPRPASAVPEPSGAPSAGDEISGTSYVAVMDRHGNAFSATPSDGYGNGAVIAGLGLHISERGSQSSLDPTNPNAVAPGKRPRLTPNPALVCRGGVPYMTFGSPGNDRQPQAMTQALSNVLRWGMNPQEAVERARVASYSFPSSSFPHHYEPGKLRVEAGVPDETAEELARRGHIVERWPRWSWSAGGVCMVVRDSERGVFLGGADPRREAYVTAL
jgi:gamma-glutamyltranspeptidase/glutathione hydrolase